MVLVEGCYTLIIDGHRIPLSAGQECFVRREKSRSVRYSFRVARRSGSAPVSSEADGVFQQHSAGMLIQPVLRE